MKDKSITSLKEDDLLAVLEKMALYLAENTQKGKDILVTGKQEKMLADLALRVTQYGVVDRAGLIYNLSREGKSYRGFLIKGLEEGRKHRKTDMLSLPLAQG